MQHALQQLAARDRIERHRHAGAYMAVVLDGGYVEAGDSGRFQVDAGDLVVHGRFEAHQNHAGATGATVRNLPIEDAMSITGGCWRPANPDAMIDAMRAGERFDVCLAVANAEPIAPLETDWPDMLAVALRSDPTLRLEDWAAEAGVRTDQVSRGFGGMFGVSPKRYRADVRVLAALRALPAHAGRLAALAAELGYADQAHMSRAVHAVTGRTPSAWIASAQLDSSRVVN